MSRDPRYQKLLNSKRWKMIRAEYLRQHPLCERCRREGIAAGVLPDGYITSAVDVHHKTPVERGRTQQEMEWLAYNLGGNNLEALCIPCHIKTHQEMRSHTKEKVAENKARARRRFMEANDPNYGRDNEGQEGKDVDSHEDGQRGLPSSDQHDEG